MSLSDDLVDVALMIRGIRSAGEAEARLPAILARLRSAAGSVRRLKPGRRRDPSADHALDWLHRSIADAPIAEGQRSELAEVLGGLKRLVGPGAAGWRESPRRRRVDGTTEGRRWSGPAVARPPIARRLGLLRRPRGRERLTGDGDGPRACASGDARRVRVSGSFIETRSRPLRRSFCHL